MTSDSNDIWLDLNQRSIAVNVESDSELLSIEFSYPDIHTFKFESNKDTLCITLLINSSIMDVDRIEKELVLVLSNTKEVEGNTIHIWLDV